MATIIGSLRVLLGLNSTQYSTGLRKAAAETVAFTSKSTKLGGALIGNWKKIISTVSLVGLALRSLRSVREEFGILTEVGQLTQAAAAVGRLSDAWRSFIQGTLVRLEPALTRILNTLSDLMVDPLGKVMAGPRLAELQNNLNQQRMFEAEVASANKDFADFIKNRDPSKPLDIARLNSILDRKRMFEQGLENTNRAVEELRRKLETETPEMKPFDKPEKSKGGSFGGFKSIGGQEIGFRTPSLRGIGNDQVPSNIATMTDLLRSIDGRLERNANELGRQQGVAIV